MRRLHLALIFLLTFAAFPTSSEARIARQDGPSKVDNFFPQRQDLTVLQWTAEDSLRWELVVRTASGKVLHLSQQQPDVDRWTAEVRDASDDWWARYTLDLGMDDETKAELGADWANGDWFATMSRLNAEGRLNVVHRLGTSDGLTLSQPDTGTGEPVRELGRTFQEKATALRSQSVAETVAQLVRLAMEGYFQRTGQFVQLMVVLSGGQLTAESVMGLRLQREKKLGASEGGSSGSAQQPVADGADDLMGDPGDDATPQTQFCNGDPDHYAHPYPFDFDTCTKNYNPHYPSYQFPNYCVNDPGCGSCQRRTKNIGACCGCCESQYSEKIHCDCWLGGFGGCEGLAANVRSKCENEGCALHFEAYCPS